MLALLTLAVEAAEVTGFSGLADCGIDLFKYTLVSFL
jgi:hypothetical protein